MSDTILLLEDDTTLLWANQGILELEGWQVLACSSIQEAREAVWEQSPDLMILDVMLPDGSGVDFCREYREHYGSGAAVLFLTVLDGSEDILAGYDAGGADYLVKPFDLNILLLKVRALLQNRKAAAETLQIGPLRLDCRSNTAYLEGTDLLLTPKEYSILEYLARSRSRYVPSAELYEAVWGMQALTEHTVKQHIYRVREKLGKSAHIDIISQRGQGYRLIRRKLDNAATDS